MAEEHESTKKNNDLSTRDRLRRAAVSALETVATDAGAPAAARAQAARTLLELLGELGRNAAPGGELAERDVSTMSAQELDQELARMRRLCGGEARQARQGK